MLGDAVPVTFLLMQNLESFLPPSFEGRTNTRGASVVISSQVGRRNPTSQSQALLDQPISLNFTFDSVSII